MVSHAFSLRRMNLARPEVCTPPPPPPPAEALCWLKLITPQPIHCGQWYQIQAHALFSRLPIAELLTWDCVADFSFLESIPPFPNGSTLTLDVRADYDEQPALESIVATWSHPPDPLTIWAAIYFPVTKKG